MFNVICFMNFIIKSFKCFCYWVKGLFKKKFKKGKIILSPGSHKIGIGTDCCPKAVYLDVQEPCDGITTCVGDLNWVVAKLDKCRNEFTIFAEVKSRSCTVNYIVEY